MIVDAKIITQPCSGQYREVIYDISSPWNSQKWTWVKFTNDNFIDWCGEFRGAPRQIAISKKHNAVLILTTDYLYQIDCLSEKIIDYESQPQYQNLTTTPSGDFLISDSYGIDLIELKLKEKKVIEIPTNVDDISFIGWSNNKLLIRCDEFLNWSNKVELEFDNDTLEIKLKNKGCCVD